MNTFSAQAMIGYGWDAFKKRKQFFVGVAALWFLIQFAVSMVADQFPQAPEDGAALWLLGMLISGAISAVVNMGLIAFSLKAHDAPEDAMAALLWHPHPFWKYVGASIMQSIIVLVGLVLLIVPGVIAALALSFTTFLVIDRELAPLDALRESARITKGHRLELLFLFIGLLLINVLGVLALLVGLLVSVPVSYLAAAHAYRTLATAAPITGESVSA